VALLLAACQAGGAGVVPTSAPSTPAGSSGPAASASASPAAPSSAPASAPSAPAAAIDPRTDGLDVTFGEYAITLEAAVIRPGHVTLVIHNAGHLTHGFEMKIDSSGKGGGDRRKIETRTFRSGESLRVEADLPPGVYEVECFVADHASKGMRTSLEVRADAPLQTPDPEAPAPGTVRIVQFAFVPASLDVPVGTRVTWANDDPAPHTVTADGRAFDSKQLDPGASYSVVLETAGIFPFHCEIHPTMVGEVRVH
jgi:plastocyanin